MSLFASDLPDDLHVGDHEVPGSGRTPPPARTPRTDGRVDLEEWGGPAPVGARRRWLLLAAVVPWVVVVAIMLTDRDPAADAPPVGRPTSTASATPSPASGTPPSERAPAAPTATGVDVPSSNVVAIASAAGPGGRGAAEGLALVVARSWLSTRPPGATIDGLAPAPTADGEYVEHLAVESVDHPARGAIVVTVHAIVLPVEGDRYGAARSRRVAVPVVLDTGGARLGGAPWPLPAPTVDMDPPEQAPTDDPDLMLAAVDAITAVGYRDVELVELARTSGWAWVARVRARAPGEPDVRDHQLWLRSDVGRLVVAGAPAPATGRPPTAGPTADPDPEPAERPDDGTTPAPSPHATEAPS